MDTSVASSSVIVAPQAASVQQVKRPKVALWLDRFQDDLARKPLPAGSPLKIIPDALDRIDDIFSTNGLKRGLTAVEDAKIAGWTGLAARIPGLATLSYGAETFNALAHHHWPTALFAGAGTMISGTLTGLLDLKANDYLKRWASKVKI